MATTATSWSSWSSYFDLTEINVGYYAKIEGTTVAMSKAEFEVVSNKQYIIIQHET